RPEAWPAAGRNSAERAWLGLLPLKATSSEEEGPESGRWERAPPCRSAKWRRPAARNRCRPEPAAAYCRRSIHHRRPERAADIGKRQPVPIAEHQDLAASAD